MKTTNPSRFINRSTDKFFSCKDWREQLQVLIRGYSYNDAENWYRQGMIKERAWLAFVRLWHWTAPRMSSDRQERFLEQNGKEAFLRKLNRTRAAFGFAPVVY